MEVVCILPRISLNDPGYGDRANDPDETRLVMRKHLFTYYALPCPPELVVGTEDLNRLAELRLGSFDESALFGFSLNIGEGNWCQCSEAMSREALLTNAKVFNVCPKQDGLEAGCRAASRRMLHRFTSLFLFSMGLEVPANLVAICNVTLAEAL